MAENKNRMNSIDTLVVESQVVDALRTCFDPEIPVNVYDLGLIYEVKVDEKGSTEIRMTLTTPHCPAAQMLPSEVEAKARTVPGVSDVQVEVVWDPPWDPSKMSEAAKLQLGML
ncbi:MAG: SUF system Fe-S cluster assembly protein [Deltaproteobacteria bacterium]|nr:SUF system Fe-S cluster assembly protein [Deltaproteobacteria bacterium]